MSSNSMNQSAEKHLLTLCEMKHSQESTIVPLNECLERWNKDSIKWLFNTLKSACSYTPLLLSSLGQSILTWGRLHIWFCLWWGWEAMWFNDQRCKGEERWNGERIWNAGSQSLFTFLICCTLGSHSASSCLNLLCLQVAMVPIPSPSCSVYCDINWGPKQWN